MVWTKPTSVPVTVSQVVYKHSLLLEDRKTSSYFHFHFDVQINPLTTFYAKFVTMNCLVQYSDSEDELSNKEDPDHIHDIGMKRKNPTNFQVCTENNKKLR